MLADQNASGVAVLGPFAIKAQNGGLVAIFLIRQLKSTLKCVSEKILDEK